MSKIAPAKSFEKEVSLPYGKGSNIKELAIDNFVLCIAHAMFWLIQILSKATGNFCKHIWRNINSVFKQLP